MIKDDIMLINTKINKIYQGGTLMMNKKFNGLLIILVSAILILIPINAHAAGVVTLGVAYKTQVQSIGWEGLVHDGANAGTIGQAKRLEAVKINLTGTLPAGASIQYEVQGQTYGWNQGWKSDGQEAGTTGQSKRLEAIKIKLVNMPGYSVQYRVQVQSYGWQDWVTDGAIAGTVGQSKRLETLDVKIAPPVTIHSTFVSLNKTTDNLSAGDPEGSTDTLIATVSPSNAINQAITWTSSNSAVATVDSTGKVTAVIAGTATITATTIDGSQTADCTVTITNAPFNGYKYTVSGNTATITGYTSAETNITIPNSIHGYTVTSISDNAFNNSYIASVNIPSSITSIGNNAFNDCRFLTSVIIPSGVINIGEGAFEGCYGLTSMTMPNSVTNIGADAFKSCFWLTSVTIPSNVTNIGDNAFYGCYGLTAIYAYPTTAPITGLDTFMQVPSTAVLHIPTGATGYDVAPWAEWTQLSN